MATTRVPAAGPPAEPPAIRQIVLRWAPLLVAAAALVAGTLAAIYYSRLGLALAHHDARAHLVVARRILDSLTPGWQQIGAVWLPLPHVLNMLPVQVDEWYRTGASGVAISVLSMAVAAWSLVRLTAGTAGSVSAGLAGAALLFANANVLYVQSTPMTEPLLIGTTLLATVWTVEWVESGAPLPPRRPGWAIVAACMTRYEAWPICGALIVLAAVALLRRGTPIAHVIHASARLALYPLIAGILFSANSRWTTGTWFVPSNFYVPDNPALGHAALAIDQVRVSTYQLSGPPWVWTAYAAAALLVVMFVISRKRASLVLVLALAGAAAVPLVAYYQGHPVRIRYGLPLVVACASIGAAGIAVLPRPVRAVAAALVVAWTLAQSNPLDRTAPMIIESQRDARNMQGRRAVTDYLRDHWDGTTIMMSMGSLAHYMHDLTELNLSIRDFLQEGNENLWVFAATHGPRGYVTWVVVEEQAEGGDALFQAAQRDPDFLAGFERVAAGGGAALYRAR